MCRTPFIRHKRINGQRDKPIYARNRIWCILALKCDIWWQYFNDFPDNQLIKFRVLYWLIPDFLSPTFKIYVKNRASSTREAF